MMVTTTVVLVNVRNKLRSLPRERATPLLDKKTAAAQEPATPPGIGVGICGVSAPLGPVPSPLLVLLHRRRLRVSAHAVAHAKSHVERVARALLDAVALVARPDGSHRGDPYAGDPWGPALRGDFVPAGSGYEQHAIVRPDSYDLLIPLRVPAAAGCVPALCAARSTHRARCGEGAPTPHGHCPLRAPLACRALAEGFCCPTGAALCPERVHAWFRGAVLRAAGAVRARLGAGCALAVSARESRGRVVVRILPRADFVCCRLPLRVWMLPALPLAAAAAASDDGGDNGGGVGAAFLTPQWGEGETPSLNPAMTPTSTRTPTQIPTQSENQTPTETPTATPTLTPTQTPKVTQTLTPTSTATPTPNLTPTHASTSPQTRTQTPTSTPTSPPEFPCPAPAWRALFPAHEQRLFARLAALGGPGLGPHGPSEPGARGPPCHITCLQLLKAFRDVTGAELRHRDPAAAALWSRLLCTFHLKAALFHLILGSSTSTGPCGANGGAAEEAPGGNPGPCRAAAASRSRGHRGQESGFPETWGEERLSQRLGDLVTFLRGCLDRGQLPHPFLGSAALVPATAWQRSPQQPERRPATRGTRHQQQHQQQLEANLLQGVQPGELRWVSARLEFFWNTVAAMAEREARDDARERAERCLAGRSAPREGAGDGAGKGPAGSTRKRPPTKGTPNNGPPDKVTPTKGTPTKGPPP
ncbi:inositol 1,4,5-trisphosphate receptor-interacting protein-like 2 [Lampetra planeri]